MLKVVHDINAYVEEDIRYQIADVLQGEGEQVEVVTPGYAVDTVIVELDESTNRVTVLPAFVPNVEGGEAQAIETHNPIVDRTLDSLPEAIKYYQEMIHQLEQGDIIRNV